MLAVAVGSECVSLISIVVEASLPVQHVAIISSARPVCRSRQLPFFLLCQPTFVALVPSRAGRVLQLNFLFQSVKPTEVSSLLPLAWSFSWCSGLVHYKFRSFSSGSCVCGLLQVKLGSILELPDRKLEGS
jgi:hypothetical protein